VSARSVGVVAFAGILFGVGLVLSGMTEPHKVSGFLDVTGAWDPSLAFVMIGAIGVHLVARRFIVRRPAPIDETNFEEPKPTKIDAPLVAGAAIFGVGWGLGGFCPGPALVSLGSGSLEGIVFVTTMSLGMLAHRWVRTSAPALVAQSVDAMRTKPIGAAQTDG
jgi:uncharacterized membrane protein YedE/YeeE